MGVRKRSLCGFLGLHRELKRVCIGNMRVLGETLG